MEKSPEAFRTISEVAHDLDLPQHVLRFWETRFNHIKPLKRGGGRRYYRPDDIDLLRGIRHLLYSEGYTIRGVQRILKEQGVKFVQVVWKAGSAQPSRDDADVEPIVSVVDSENAGPRLFGLIPSLLSGQSEPSPSRSERRGPLFDLLEGKKITSIVVDKAGDDDDDEEEIDEEEDDDEDDDEDDNEDDDEDDIRDGVEEAVELRSKSTPPAVKAVQKIPSLDHVKPGLERAANPSHAPSADDRQRLQSVLDELKECQRTLDAAIKADD